MMSIMVAQMRSACSSFRVPFPPELSEFEVCVGSMNGVMESKRRESGKMKDDTTTRTLPAAVEFADELIRKRVAVLDEIKAVEAVATSGGRAKTP